MGLNRQHPDCAEYVRKFKEIWSYYAEREKEERAKYPNWGGKDHPADSVLSPLRRECCKATKDLQQEYAYLFTSDTETRER